MYDQQILQELYQINNYLYSNGQQESAIFNKIIDIQDQINSGDNMIENYMIQTNQNITLIAIIVALLVLLNFVERCFK